jgi:ABC-type uncharacterized transport system substrate-binding protein
VTQTSDFGRYDPEPTFGKSRSCHCACRAPSLAAVYTFRDFVTAGGLMYYGTGLITQFRRAASYVDRVFQGANPADLPVEAPTKYETVLNLKTAKALGFQVPLTLLVRADEVIE